MSGGIVAEPVVGDAGLNLTARQPFDVDRVRQDFPILQEQIHGQPLVYLDNAATAQKPQAVIDAVLRFYSRENANVHRGVHYLSGQASTAFDAVRVKVAEFINARAPLEHRAMAIGL